MQGLTTELVNAVFMATKLAGEMLMITVCENLKRFTGRY